MRCTENNIAKLQSVSEGIWKDRNHNRLYLKVCDVCGVEYLGRESSKYCCKKCFANRTISQSTRDKIRVKATGRKHTDDSKRKMSNAASKRTGRNNSFYGKHHTEENKKRISETKIERTGGYYSKGIPTYDTYASQLEWAEEVRRNKDDTNVLEVKCFKCGKWFVPKLWIVRNRVLSINSLTDIENRFYCSEECKMSCSIYHKPFNVIMKEDAIRAGRLQWLELNREVQPELRQMVLKRDDYSCVKCGSSDKPLHCHHILPVAEEPLLSADIDNCITLCEDCHKEVHKLPGCGYNEIKIEVC